MIPRLFHQHQARFSSALRRKRPIDSDSAFFAQTNKLIRMFAMRVSDLNESLEDSEVLLVFISLLQTNGLRMHGKTRMTPLLMLSISHGYVAPFLARARSDRPMLSTIGGFASISQRS